MRIGVIGVNHKQATLKLREALARCSVRWFGTNSLSQKLSPVVLLSTCNRTEIYFSSDNLAQSHSDILDILRREVSDPFDQKLYSYFGEDCFLHLARVAIGLDSAIVAETEIQGQVKGAYLTASSCCSLPQELHFLFQKVLKIGKEMRTQYPMRRGMPDIEHTLFATGCQFFPHMRQAKILFIGASEINRKMITFFSAKKLPHLFLCNRSQERAEKLATKYGITPLPWEALNQWWAFDWLIFGTKATEPLIVQPPPANKRAQLIIDLSVPRNVDPRIGTAAHLTLLNIDQVMRTVKMGKKQISHNLQEVEEAVLRATRRQLALYHKRKQLQLLANSPLQAARSVG